MNSTMIHATTTVVSNSTELEVHLEQVSEDCPFVFAVDISGRPWILAPDNEGETFAVSHLTEEDVRTLDATVRLADLDYPVTTLISGRIPTGTDQ